MRVGAARDIPAGHHVVVELDADRSVAVVNVDGRFYAVDNLCPHRGGPLGEGRLTGTVLHCPWHGWQFCVTTGRMVQNRAVRIACYPVVVENGEVMVVLP